MPIHAKINKVMQLVRGVEKTRTNTHGKFKYAGHEDVNQALRGHFAELGIVRIARMLDCQIVDGGIILARCLISYIDVVDDTRIDIDMWAVQPSQTSKGGVTAQQIGQALSYATKNVEFKLFALTGDNEADSDSTEAYNPNEQADESVPAHELGALARAGELLCDYTKAETLAQVEEVNAKFKAEWSTLRGVPNLAERVVEVRNGAIKRVKGGES